MTTMSIGAGRMGVGTKGGGGVLLAAAWVAGALGMGAPAGATHRLENSAGANGAAWNGWDNGSEVRFFSFSENGRSVTVEIRDGRVSRATVDGEEVPAERVSLDGQRLKITSESGGTVFERELAAPPSPPAPPVAGNRERVREGERRMWFGGGTPRFGRGDDGGDDDPPAGTPTVMVGVQLAEPDDGVRGHLGLEEGAATFITMVSTGLPADQAGIQPYDVVVAINGSKPAGPGVLREAIQRTPAGSALTLTVLRAGVERQVALAPVAYDARTIERAEKKSVKSAGAWPARFGPEFAEEMERAFAQGFGTRGGGPFMAIAPQPPAPPGTGAAGGPGARLEPRQLLLTPNAFGGGLSTEQLEEWSARMTEMHERVMEQLRMARELSQREAAEGGAAAPGQNDRLERLEKLLQQLIEERAREGKGGGKKAGQS